MKSIKVNHSSLPQEMHRRMRDLVSGKASESFVGREKEIATLLSALQDQGHFVTHVHGIGGIGKSSLLDARVVLPTPPFWFEIAIVTIFISINRNGIYKYCGFDWMIKYAYVEMAQYGFVGG